jgi:peptide/nickel transport system substrate-binding protein
MTKLVRILSLGLMLALLMTLAGVVVAQDGSELPGPGEGGIVVRPNTRGSGNIGPLVTIRCSGVDCADINALIYPGLIGLDPETQQYAPNLPGTLATDWEISEDGTTYTFFLRDDLTWNDGTPITAEDVFFTWEAMQNPEAIGLSSSYATMASLLVDAEVIDDYTIALSFEEPNCDSLRYTSMPVVPAHAFGYGEEGFDFSALAGSPFDREPTITYGPFQFTRIEPGTAIYLEDDQNYVQAYDGFVRPSGFVYLDVPDEVVSIERFLTFQPGEINYISEPSGSVIPQILASEAQALSAPGRTWHYVALNLADPSNPQNGLDENGNPIDQGNHPIFGDVRVRQALQHAIDINQIIEGPLNGEATAMTADNIPTAWTIHPDLERRAFDLDTARALLDEAGWVSTGDPLEAGGDGLRTCQGCEYAEEGSPLTFELMNVGDVRNDVSILLQDMFADIGVQVEVVVLDFNTMYDNNMGAQTYDAAVAGWRGALPFNPDQRSFFGAENDVTNTVTGDAYGFNFPSYYNARVEELYDVITFGSCDPDEIQAAAWEAQEILWEEQPYLWLYAFNSLYATAPNVANFAPLPNFGAWNIDTWAVVE